MGGVHVIIDDGEEWSAGLEQMGISSYSALRELDPDNPSFRQLEAVVAEWQACTPAEGRGT